MAAEEGEEKAKKLANEIRGSTESTEFDLAGYGGEQCAKLAAAAFSKPLPLAEMIRLSFVVGGGKKVRQKYNDALPAGWAATWDGQQGCVYYYNEGSGETSWARPT